MYYFKITVSQVASFQLVKTPLIQGNTCDFICKSPELVLLILWLFVKSQLTFSVLISPGKIKIKWIVLFYDTQSNDARLMHKLCLS